MRGMVCTAQLYKLQHHHHGHTQYRAGWIPLRLPAVRQLDFVNSGTVVKWVYLWSVYQDLYIIHATVGGWHRQHRVVTGVNSLAFGSYEKITE